MKKLIAILLLFALTLAVAGCASELTEPKDTPVRVATLSRGHANANVPKSLEEAIKRADLIVDLTITEWLGEDLEGRTTFFNARINETIMGEKKESITLMQTGTGEFTLWDWPLFKNGDRLFLFLVEILPEDAERLDKIYAGGYWVVGSYTTVFDVQELDENIYLLSRFGFMDTWPEKNYIEETDENITRVLVENFNKSDPIVAEVRGVHRSAYSYESFEKVIAEILKEVERQ
ncbi:MAG: hypothetical protein LBC82_00595 [Oscillospiraceae bacterium]|nr:hypothetical protein [Oscillospiraceae bacterium]